MGDDFFRDRVGVGWGGFGGNASDGERAMGSERWEANEASPARPPLTSCCAAWLLTGRGWGGGGGDPCSKT